MNTGRRRANEIKFKDQIDEIKEEWLVRLFAVNCNGSELFSEIEIEQVEKESKSRRIDRTLISSSGVR